MSNLQVPENSGKYAFFDGKIVNIEDATVNIMTHALQYGTACFSGLRGYWNEDKKDIFLFRPKDHYKRMAGSARILQMELPGQNKDLLDWTIELIRKENWQQNIYIRPFLYKSDLSLSPRLHNVGNTFSIYTLSLDDYLDVNAGLTTIISSWQRISDQAIPTRSKASGGYINSALAKSEALMAGKDEAIFLNSKGNIAEGSAENIFMVRDGKLITPSLDQDILEGIVRRSIIEIAQKEFGLEVIERPIAPTELYIADELFFSGTGVQVAWIKEVDYRQISNGKIGPISKKIQDLFFNIVSGKKPKYENWITSVYN